jgi:hypothetical protein
MTPLKTIFRIFNPERSYTERIDDLEKGLFKMNDKESSGENSEGVGSATSLQKHL